MSFWPGAAVGAGLAIGSKYAYKRARNDSMTNPVLVASRKRRKLLVGGRTGGGASARRAVKLRARSGRSYTKRRKRKQRKARVGAQRGNDGAFISVFYKKPKKSRYITWGKQPMTYEQIIGFSVESGSLTSTQSTQIIQTVHKAANIAIGGSSILGELFNRHAKIQDSAGPSTINVDPEYPTQRYNTLYFKNLRLEVNVTNQAPTTTEFDVYIIARKTSQTTYISSAGQADWSAGLTVMDAGGTTLTNSFIDTKPTMSKRFNLNWRIMGKFMEKLNAGEERKLVYNLAVNRFLDSDHWVQYGGGIKGIAHEIVCVARGPTADASNGFSAGAIATAKVKVVGFAKAIYTTYACQIYSRLHYMATNLSTSNASLYSIADAAGTVINTEVSANYA